MKVWTVFLLLSVIGGGIFVSSISATSVNRFEEGQYYSMGIASEQRLYDFSEKNFPSEGERSKDIAVCAEGEKRGSIFADGGSLSMRFDSEENELRLGVESKLSTEEMDYRSFAFKDRMEPLHDPLEDGELCYVFSRIVSSSTATVPIKGMLEEISFSKEGEKLIAVAEIDLDFSLLKAAYALAWIPEHARFCICIPFFVKESEISVDFDGIILRCESFELPEALLVFGCNAAFGKRDYRTLFGEAVKNVFVNAGIYR